MIRLGGGGAVGPRKPAASRVSIWLVASLLLMFVQACQRVTEPGSIPTRGVTGSAVGLPSFTASLTQVTAQTQTIHPSFFTQTYTPQPTVSEPVDTPSPEPTALTSPAVVFAAIGDYGSGDREEADVAHLILSWQPDFIITLGDNNYPSGAADHMDAAVGQFFHSYIDPYKGSYGAGAEVNRFFPSLGNHDLVTDHGQPYYDYFTLPGNERYYDFIWGSLHCFALNTNDSEPDGVGASSVQAQWLKAGLSASTSAWNIVYMHYPPYSSGLHGSTDWARWPYAEWGADAVLAGHDHTYERLEVNGLTYFVNGLGGAGRYNFMNILEGSLARYNTDYGAMRVEAMDTHILFEFINRSNEVVDSYEIRK
jgi:tartrate-resistant acid phosphatase type 5